MTKAQACAVLGSIVTLATFCTAQSLREAADHAGILIGTAVNEHFLSEPDYASTLAREFNMIEPENAMKWAAIRPNEKTFDFERGDRVVAFAQAHGMKVRGHNLVWPAEVPAWVRDGRFSKQQLARLLHQHIHRVIEHYRGQVFAWDVVNEAFEEHGRLRESVWHKRPGIGVGRGTAYIAQAFRWAHQADPAALLFYNDAEAEPVNRKSNAIYAMVKRFKQQNVPIDGVGFQMHIFNLRANVASIEANIARFTRLGVQVHITEMDVALPVDSQGRVLDPADLRRQAEIYRDVAAACLKYSGCTALQTWGFTDKYSWIGWETHHARGAALLFDRAYQPKPAYDALVGLLESRSNGR